MRVAASTLMSIINDVLDFSKIENSDIELRHDNFLIEDLIENVAGYMSAQLCNKCLEPTIEYSSLNGYLLAGDHRKLEQVLINLIGNSFKFSETGYIRLKIEITDETNDRVQLLFKLIDTGIGITPEKQNSIFLEFTQGDDSISQKFGGSGLGLAISQRLVNAMGGKIELKSTVGVGSEFYFQLSFEKRSTPLQTFNIKNLNSILIYELHPNATKVVKNIAKDININCHAISNKLDFIQRLNAESTGSTTKDILIIDEKYLKCESDSLIKESIEKWLSHKERNLFILGGQLFSTAFEHIKHTNLRKPLTRRSLLKELEHFYGSTSNSNDIKEKSRLAGVRILVVDDSEINCEILRRIFIQEEAAVWLAYDGIAAIKLTNDATLQFDVIIMDIRMPVIDGYELTREIRNNSRYSETPIIALTAGAFTDNASRAKAAGMNGFLTKPIDIERAIDLICDLLDLGKRDEGIDQSLLYKKDEDLVMEGMPGINWSEGLKIWKDEAAYERCLRLFVEHYYGLLSSFESSEANDLLLMAHKIKGTASSLGLYAIEKAADLLEKSIISGVAADSYIETLRVEMETVAVTLGRL